MEAVLALHVSGKRTSYGVPTERNPAWNGISQSRQYERCLLCFVASFGK